MSDVFYTVEEFANLLKLNRPLIYKWIRLGRIKALALGEGPKPRWRIPKTEMQRLLAQPYLEELTDESEKLGFYNE